MITNEQKIKYNENAKLKYNKLKELGLLPKRKYVSRTRSEEQKLKDKIKSALHPEWQKQANINYFRTYKSKLKSWKQSAKHRNIEWNLTLEFIESLPLICAYTGRQLTLETNHINTISLDRIDNKKGYTEDNVVLCCVYINLAKNDLELNEFYKLFEDVVSHKAQSVAKYFSDLLLGLPKKD